MQMLKGKARRLINRLLYGKPYRPAAPDDFILRLPSSVIGEGMLHPGNVWLMEQAVEKMPEGGCVLEIGSHGGLSANLLVYLLQKYRRAAALYCCDAWIYEGYHDREGRATPWIDGRDDVSRADYTAYIKNAFIQSVRLLSAHSIPHVFHLESDTFFRLWRQEAVQTDLFGREVRLGGPVAFAYIDGNHAYDYAKRDFENALSHLLPGGYILLDDSASHLSFGSAFLAKELRRRRDIIPAGCNPNYLWQKI